MFNFLSAYDYSWIIFMYHKFKTRKRIYKRYSYIYYRSVLHTLFPTYYYYYFPHEVNEMRTKKTATPTHTYSHNTPLNNRFSIHTWDSPTSMYKRPVINNARTVGLLGQNHDNRAVSPIISVIVPAHCLRGKGDFCWRYVHSD